MNAGAELLAVTEVTAFPRPAYRLTLSLVGGGHCNAADVLFALADFDMLEAQEEDFALHAAARIFTCPAGD